MLVQELEVPKSKERSVAVGASKLKSTVLVAPSIIEPTGVQNPLQNRASILPHIESGGLNFGTR